MDDDRLIASMVTALAEPRTPPPDALMRIRAITARSRRRQRVVRVGALVAAAVAIVGAVVTVPRLVDRGPTSADGERPMSVNARFHGFGLETSVVFPTDRFLVRGRYVVDGRSGEIGFYNNDGADQTYNSLAVHGGDSVFLDGSVTPSCESGWGWPIAIVTSRLADGRTVTDEFKPDTASRQAYRAEREWWCSAPAHAAMMISGRGPKGRAHFQMDIDNATSHPITVVSAHLRDGTANWTRSSVVVPPRGRAELSVSATGYFGGPTPWDRGLLTADGVPIHPPRR
jgi:hypothetical protein